MSPYKCESHQLDIACINCGIAMNRRHDRMLEFIKKIASDIDHCVSPAIKGEAGLLLKEIGEYSEEKDKS